MARSAPPAPFDGLVVVDKPAEWTSHDVVGRLRRICETRRVGHGGTLDPMATGVLVCGVGKATKLLGFIGGEDKTYRATIRLGAVSTTDDADGEITAGADASALLQAGVTAIDDAIGNLTGDIMQRPSSVSAIKVNGQRAYHRVRAGEDVQLAQRPVHIAQFEVVDRRAVVAETRAADPLVANAHGYVDLDVVVTCSTGTYIRALARDLGEALGVGGYLTMLQRTRVGSFDLAQARTLEALADDLVYLPLADACRSLFGVRVISDPDVLMAFRHGQRINDTVDGGVDSAGAAAVPDGKPTPVAVFAASGEVLGLAELKGSQLAPSVVWQPANQPSN